ncbi:flagellar motor protein MotB [Jonesiaceae bacterium BS-20]|uniref:Flagellar motor protein MotB n=1 Tax=Jonesiaceae bacterium BS-20 TaxID=3120821 RepID=A0AAU7DVV7_9MICO
MSARRKRRNRGGVEEESSASERWLVSYADMLTVLVGLFIVLYAMSQVDQAKFEQLAASLAVGFGGESQSVLSSGSTILAQTGPVVPNITPSLETPMNGPGGQSQEVNPEAIDPEDLAAARSELENLQALAKALEAALEAKDLESSVTYRITERGLVVGLVSDELFFVADTAQLTETSKRVVDVLAPVLGVLPNQLSIEGHANSVPSVRYPTNWELSADRSTQVLRRFVEEGELNSTRIASVGFGESRPLIDNTTTEGLAVNRRVDVVILSAEPEHIRELIPVVQETLADNEEK